MNTNAYHGNQGGIVNNYQRGSNQLDDHEAGYGYQYLNDNNNNNQYNATNQAPHNSNGINYPQTGLTLADTYPQETSTEFILPPNVKLGMMCCSIFCFFLFFVAMLIK